MDTALAFRGNTQTAQYLDGANQAMGQYFRQSIAFGKQAAYGELAKIWEECRASNWDGYDALAVEVATLRNTYSLIESLPLGYPLPSIGAEPDGHLTLEWYRHPRWILSVSISPEGKLFYAALFGNSDIRGSEPYLDEVPQSILDLVQRVHIA